MIDQIRKEDCNGCKMCRNICPKDAISYQTDQEGFWYPVVDYDRCVSCSLCVSKCPNINARASGMMENPRVFAAWTKDDEVRLASTSGGMFYELATEVLKNGGYVAGCVYTEDFKGARHILIHSLEELPPLMVSKYVQSDTEEIYKKTKDLLSQGSTVLFVGAPCHCAAMQTCAGKNCGNLILCDFICRGANSPKAHRKYVEMLETKYGARITSLRSKDKRNGWNHFGQSATFANGAEYYAGRNQDLRIVAYHKGNLMMRESCNDCKFKQLPRVSDITLGDFWSISPDEVKDIEKGVSLVLLNSDKGERLFQTISTKIDFTEKTIEDVLKGNTALFTSAPKGKNRDEFLSKLDEMPFDLLVERYRDKDPTILKRIQHKIRKFTGKILNDVIKGSVS